MSEIADWIQGYWFELSSLALQCSILVAILWFARKALAALPSRETAMPHLGEATAAATRPDAAQQYRGSPRGLIPMEASGAVAAPGPSRVSRADSGLWRGVVRWLKTPMKHDPALLWRRTS